MLQKVPSEANPKVCNHGEGPSRGLLRDYEPSDLLRMELFEALLETVGGEEVGKNINQFWLLTSC